MSFLQFIRYPFYLGLLTLFCSCEFNPTDAMSKKAKLVGKYSGLINQTKIKVYLYENGYYTISEQEAVSRLNNIITSYKWLPLPDKNMIQLYKTNGEKHSVIKLIDSTRAEIQLNNQVSFYALKNIQ